MDPFSVVCRALTLLEFSKGLAVVIRKIANLKDCPKDIRRVSNELSELEVLVIYVKDAAERSQITDETAIARYKELMSHAQDTINDVDYFLKHRLIKNPDALHDETQKIVINKVACLQASGRLQKNAQVLNKLRQSIMSVLNVLDFDQNRTCFVTIQKVHGAIETLQSSFDNIQRQFPGHLMVNSTSSSEVLTDGAIHPGPKLLTSTTEHGQMSKVVEMVDDIELGEGGNVGELNEDNGVGEENQVSNRGDLAWATSNDPDDDIFVDALVTQDSSLSALCGCSCHSSLAFRTPQWLGTAIGTLLLSRSADSTGCVRCQAQPCGSSCRSAFKVQYSFPRWMFDQMVSVRMHWSLQFRLLLQSQRLVPANSTVFYFAQHNNIEGMRRLFEQRIASPLDISNDEGRTPLHFAVTAERTEMVTFLLEQGADPQLEDRNALTPHDVVWNYFLQNPGDKKMEELLFAAGLYMSSTESLEKREFSTIHKIVLGLARLDLEEYLNVAPMDEINKVDSLGRTPLSWASSRQDPVQVAILLKAGASPSISDRRRQSPLHYCAGSGLVQSTKYILQATERRYEGDDLNDVVDARDSKSRTPLNFATRMDSPIHAALLLSFGASPECSDHNGRTILLSALYWNSHKVLPVLLESGANTRAVDNDGRTVLHYAARFADLQSLKILAIHQIEGPDIECKDKDGLTCEEIFNNPHERCIAEHGWKREEAVGFFTALLRNCRREKGEAL